MELLRGQQRVQAINTCINVKQVDADCTSPLEKERVGEKKHYESESGKPN